jgi:hypothetical protein
MSQLEHEDPSEDLTTPIVQSIPETDPTKPGLIDQPDAPDIPVVLIPAIQDPPISQPQEPKIEPSIPTEPRPIVKPEIKVEVKTLPSPEQKEGSSIFPGLAVLGAAAAGAAATVLGVSLVVIPWWKRWRMKKQRARESLKRRLHARQWRPDIISDSN